MKYYFLRGLLIFACIFNQAAYGFIENNTKEINLEKAELFFEDNNNLYAVYYFQQAEVRGSVEARNKLIAFYESRADNFLSEQQYKRSFDYYKMAAGRNSHSAQLKLGEMYASGIGVEKNPDIAKYWFKKTAIDYYAPGLYALAVNFLKRNDYKNAEKYLKLSADLEYAPAILALKDPANADYELAIKAIQDPANAEYILSNSINTYLGIDHFKAPNSDSKEVDNQRKLAQKHYRSGDYKLAFEWAHTAALNGDTESQNYIGSAYFQGLGVKKSTAKAYQWFKVAASSGSSEAIYHLAILYNLTNPDGFNQNTVKGINLLEQSAAMENRVAKNRLDREIKNSPKTLFSYELIPWEPPKPKPTKPRTKTKLKTKNRFN